jgi:hypothetical protein
LKATPDKDGAPAVPNAGATEPTPPPRKHEQTAGAEARNSPAARSKEIGAALALSDFYIDRGECGQAVDVLKKALNVHPGNPAVTKKIASLRNQEGTNPCSATQ